MATDKSEPEDISALYERRANQHESFAASDYECSQVPVPLRIAIHSKLIGLVIGPRGSIINSITSNTRTQIICDNKSDDHITPFLGISIYGYRNDCSAACRQIMQVIQDYRNRISHNRYYKLRLLVPGHYLDRIVEMRYNKLDDIGLKTQTKIVLYEEAQDVLRYERTISIQGALSNVCDAESQISKTLRQTRINNPNAIATHNATHPGLQPTYQPNSPVNVFQNGHTFLTAQNLPLYFISTDPNLTTVVQTQCDTHPGLHMNQPTYQQNSPVNEIQNGHTLSPAQNLPQYLIPTGLNLTTVVQPQSVTYQTDRNTVEPTNATYEGNGLQITNQSLLPVQSLNNNSNNTDTLLDTDNGTQNATHPGLQPTYQPNSPVNVFQNGHTFLTTQNLPLYFISSDPNLTTVVQPQSVINQTDRNTVEPTNATYEGNGLQITNQSLLPVQSLNNNTDTLLDTDNRTQNATHPGLQPTYQPNSPVNVFQNGHTLSPAQNLPLYLIPTGLNLTTVVQPQSVIYQADHNTVEPSNANYEGNGLQITNQSSLPVQHLNYNSNDTDTLLNTYDWSRAITYIAERETMEPTNANYHRNDLQITNQSLLPVQSRNHNSNDTDTLLNTDDRYTVNIFIPTYSVRSLTGTRSSNIKYISKHSGAIICIHLDTFQNPIAEQRLCRKIEIVGSYEAQTKAQEIIYRTMWRMGYGPAPEEVILVIEIFVTCNQVHRMLNSDGFLVKKLEKETGCLIQVLRGNTMRCNPDLMPLHIIGSYYCSQLAQKKIRSIPDE